MDDKGFTRRRQVTGEQELRVANSTDVRYLATAILRYLDEGKRVYLSCIGVQTISQACKSVAVANGELAPQGYVLTLLPTFQVRNFEDNGETVERTVLRFSLHEQAIGL